MLLFFMINNTMIILSFVMIIIDFNMMIIFISMINMSIFPTIENEELSIWVCVIFFFFLNLLFSAQNQVPQTILGQGRAIYLIKPI